MINIKKDVNDIFSYLFGIIFIISYIQLFFNSQYIHLIISYFAIGSILAFAMYFLYKEEKDDISYINIMFFWLPNIFLKKNISNYSFLSKEKKEQIIDDLSKILIIIVYLLANIVLFISIILISVAVSLIILLFVCFIFIITEKNMIIYMIDNNFNVLLLISFIFGLIIFGELYYKNKRWLSQLKTDLML